MQNLLQIDKFLREIKQAHRNNVDYSVILDIKRKQFPELYDNIIRKNEASRSALNLYKNAKKS